MSDKLFLDRAFAIALSVERDQYHAQAVRLAEQIADEHIELVTTRAILLEVGNWMSARHYRKEATALIEDLEQDPTIEIVPVSDRVFRQGFSLYKQRTDKEWGLTDCISFVVMGERKLSDALTADSHFEQAGFKALLREPR